MVVDFRNLNLADERPVLTLMTLDDRAIQTLGYAFNVNIQLAYNEVSVLTFDLPAEVDGVKTPHYDDVVGMRLVDLDGVGVFLLVDPSETDDGVRKVKSCKGYSLEYELAKKDIFIEAGVFNLCDLGQSTDTIIGRIKECVPGWTFTVPATLMGTYRSIDDTHTKVYDFIKSVVQEKYGCIFEFDTYTRTANLVDVRATVPTKQVYLSNERLINSINVRENSDGIITCLDVSGAEGVTIRNVNPIGSNKIYNLDYFMNETNFPAALITRWRDWELACETYQQGYFDIMMEHSLKSMRVLTLQTDLTELNGDLVTLKNQLAVIIQAISQGLSGFGQSDLNKINAEIAAKQAEIKAQEQAIEAAQRDADALYTQMQAIVDTLKLDAFFKPEELEMLQKYFIEDALEDSSFATSQVASYQTNAINVDIGQNQIKFANTSIFGTSIKDADGRVTGSMFSFTGGTIALSAGETTLSANVVRATASIDNAGALMFSAYLGTGSVGSASFPSGNLTIMADRANRENVRNSVSGDDGNMVCTIDFYDGKLYFTRDTTIYEQHAIEWDLYEYGKQVLFEKASPSYEFSIESGNFLAADEFKSFARELQLGKRVYLNLGGDEVLEPYVLSVNGNYEDPGSFTLAFSSTYTSFDRSFALSKLLDQSISMGKTLSIKSGGYAEFINSGASTMVKQFMDSALDLARNAVLSSGNQAITFDDAGIQLRQWADEEHTSYDPEQIWMVNNMIAFTKDNWETANMAIGKVFDPNITNYVRTSDKSRVTGKTYYLDKNGTVWNGTPVWGKAVLYEATNTDYGIVAPYLVGTIMAGQNLYITNQSGSFSVDGNGVTVDSMKFLITHSSGTADDGTLAKALQDLSDQTTSVEANLEAEIAELNGRVDGTVTTYYQDAEPSDANDGDLWWDTDDDKLYRYDGTNSRWDLLEDSGIEEAVAAAAQAQAAADGKITTYYQPEPPVDADDGDLWWNTTTYNVGDTYTRSLRIGDNIGNMVLVCDSNSTPESPAGNVVKTDAGNMIRVVNTGNLCVYVGSENKKTLYTHSTETWAESGDVYKYTMPDNFGTITELDTGNAFYPYLFATVTVSHESGKLYRYDGSGNWTLLEDSGIEQLQTQISDTQSSLASLIENNTFLDPGGNERIIDAQVIQMQAANGNVLFDEYGMWLMNTPSKNTATTAIWFNESGILFGQGTAPIDPDVNSDTWTWTTAMNHSGVIADYIGGTKLYGKEIYGGEIHIGGDDETGYNFTVNNKGELTAKSGTFLGTVRAANVVDSDGNNIVDSAGKIVSDYLNLYGTNITSDGTTTFGIDDNGDVTISGTIKSSKFIADGDGSDEGSAYYINNGDTQKGYLCYNSRGQSPDNSERIILHSDSALKLEASGQVSIQATGGNIYLASPVYKLLAGPSMYGSSTPSSGDEGQVFFVIS